MKEWSAWLQRRVIRRLLQYDRDLFHNQFSTFFTGSEHPYLALLRFYDRYIRFATLSDELLDDILPRIRLQLSLQTDHARLLEEAPTRGTIDWAQTLERAQREEPGSMPTTFVTRLRQRSTTTPENLLTVAILLALRREVQEVQAAGIGDEKISEQEREMLVNADERTERELAAPYARDLLEEASTREVSELVEEVSAHLRPGGNAYRDLIDWWQHFQTLQIGRGNDTWQLTLAGQRSDEKMDSWFYELWLVLEFVHYLATQKAIQESDIRIEKNRLVFLYNWNRQRFRFNYSHIREETGGENIMWEHGPASRSDYTIEREKPLEITHEDKLVWREPPFVMDAGYDLGGNEPAQTYHPIKKLLGDMALLGAEQGILFLPKLPDPNEEEAQITRTLQRREQSYPIGMAREAQIHLYQIQPDFELEKLHQCIEAILHHAEKSLPERPEPICEGVWLDSDTINASGEPIAANTLLCPKKHIGKNVVDIVHAEKHCLIDGTLCHVIGKGYARPEIVRTTTRDDVYKKSQHIRQRNNEQLQQAEEEQNEEKAEQLRTQIIETIGNSVEQYTRLRGDTRQIEDKFKWIFKEYWDEHPRALAAETRHMLISGEFVWGEYEKVTLEDWAAPSIQYCRAIEMEIRRRLYNHHPTTDKKGKRAVPNEFFLKGAGWTLGSLEYLIHYTENLKKGTRSPDPNTDHNLALFQRILSRAGCAENEFQNLALPFVTAKLCDHRNHLAHGEAFTQQTAAPLRDTIIGTVRQPGILHWLTKHLDPA